MTDVLVPLDGSSLSEAALPLAALVAKATGGRLRLLQVVRPTPVGVETPVPIEPLLDEALAYLNGVAEGIRQRHGLEVVVAAEFSFPIEVILRIASEPGVSYLVMSSHGRSGLSRAVMGSIAESVLRRAPVPVFLVPAAGAAAAAAGVSRILVPLDGSELSHRAVAPAAALAEQFRAEVVLAQVAPEPREALGEDRRIVRTADEEAAALKADAEEYLASVRSQLTTQGIAASIAVRFGNPADEIVRLAEERRADLIAISTHGRTGLDRVLHGSVAEAVLRHSRVPVMTLGREAGKRS